MDASGSPSVPSGGGPFVYVADVVAPVLSPEDHHHLARVRRVRDGDEIVLGDGAGRWCRARMGGDRPEAVGPVVAEDRPEPPVSVGFALVKASKPELVVQKLTELGVDHLRPFHAARSVVRWDAARAAAGELRLAKVAREAAMQSRRSWLPTLHAPASFEEVASLDGACRADRHGTPVLLSHPLVLVGPEGGWDDEERAVALPAVGLGPHVLRAETAAIAAGTMLAAIRAGLVAEVTVSPGRGCAPTVG